VVKRGLPLVPMASTIVAVAAANVLLAFPLAWLVSGGTIGGYGPLFWILLAVVASLSATVAVLSWRGYLAGRRPASMTNRTQESRTADERTRDREETR
jgi:hypothetical protein